MGVLRSTESLEEFEQLFLIQEQQQGINTNSRKQGSQNSVLFHGMFKGGRGLKSIEAASINNGEGIVCVTSGISFLGFALVNSLLSRGYTVRLILDSPEDLEKVQEMQIFGNDDNSSVGKTETIVVTDMMDVNMLIQAFQNCISVFHTSAFADSAGSSGYSKHMADIEAKIAERVIEACVSTKLVRKCVFTSSLLSCIWRSPQNHSPLAMVVDESCWTDERLCRDEKLWYALGKTMAEKAAWKAAHGRDINLVTLCPGLVTGPGFLHRNSTASIAYLKGAQNMVRQGLLATVDVGKLAEMHISVYEAMGRTTASGRYICFDRIIHRARYVDEFTQQLGIPSRISVNDIGSNDSPVTWFELSRRKLSRLMCLSRSCSCRLF